MLENSNPEKKLTGAKLQEAYLCYLGGTKVEVLFGSFWSPLDIAYVAKVVHQQ